MLLLSVPIDLITVATTQSTAFALATPMRVYELLELAVAAALGKRSPADRRARGLRSTLEGLERGDFIVEIDGRVFYDAGTFIMCSGQVRMRFLSRRSAPNHLSTADG